MMTRKDYVKLADALLSARNEAVGPAELRGINRVLSYIADTLARDNPRFDRIRFVKAAGYDK